MRRGEKGYKGKESLREGHAGEIWKKKKPKKKTQNREGFFTLPRTERVGHATLKGKSMLQTK